MSTKRNGSPPSRKQVVARCPFCHTDGSGGKIFLNSRLLVGMWDEVEDSDRPFQLSYPAIEYHHAGKRHERCSHLALVFGKVTDPMSDREFLVSDPSPIFSPARLNALAEEYCRGRYVGQQIDFEDVPCCEYSIQYRRLDLPVDISQRLIEPQWRCTFVFAGDVPDFSRRLGMLFVHQLADVLKHTGRDLGDFVSSNA